jgi:hypothetical protein
VAAGAASSKKQLELALDDFAFEDVDSLRSRVMRCLLQASAIRAFGLRVEFGAIDIRLLRLRLLPDEA